MKTILLSLPIFITGLSSYSQADSVSLFYYYVERAESVRALTMEPNEECLKTLNHIYIPSVEECENRPFHMNLFESFLESRYNCRIEFMQEDSTNGVRDIMFEVSQNKEVVFSALLLKLSVIEQLHQEGELICQLEEYCKWADLIENW